MTKDAKLNEEGSESFFSVFNHSSLMPKNYDDPSENPFANDPVAKEAVNFLYDKLKETIPNIKVDVIWEFYIQNRPLVQKENEELRKKNSN